MTNYRAYIIKYQNLNYEFAELQPWASPKSYDSKEGIDTKIKGMESKGDHYLYAAEVIIDGIEYYIIQHKIQDNWVMPYIGTYNLNVAQADIEFSYKLQKEARILNHKLEIVECLCKMCGPDLAEKVY